jgi:hypothetical protein
MKMTYLIFNDPEEARAWDMYLAGALASSKYDTVNNADAMLLERRKRMAPPAEIVYSEQFS